MTYHDFGMLLEGNIESVSLSVGLYRYVDDIYFNRRMCTVAWC